MTSPTNPEKAAPSQNLSNTVTPHGLVKPGLLPGSQVAIYRGIITPTIHSNGTSARSLCEGYTSAYIAVDAAIDAICAAGPNGRDYYPQGDGAFMEAHTEHLARLTQLNAIREELETLAMYCIDNS